MIQIPPPSTSNTASTWYLNGTQPISGDSLPDHNEVSLVIDFEGRNLVFESDAALRAWAIDDRVNRGGFIEKLDEIAYWQDYARQRGILDDSAATETYTDSLFRANGLNQKVSAGITFIYMKAIIVQAGSFRYGDMHLLCSALTGKLLLAGL